MTSLLLVHREEQFQVPSPQVITKCCLFQTNPSLATAPYSPRSPVPLELFRQFVSALEGNAVQITMANFVGLSLLSEEFGFDGLLRPLWEFRRSIGFNEMKDSEARFRISTLEERTHHCDRDINRLKDHLTQLTTNIAQLSAEVARLQSPPLNQKVVDCASDLESKITGLLETQAKRDADHGGSIDSSTLPPSQSSTGSIDYPPPPPSLSPPGSIDFSAPTWSGPPPDPSPQQPYYGPPPLYSAPLPSFSAQQSYIPPPLYSGPQQSYIPPPPFLPESPPLFPDAGTGPAFPGSTFLLPPFSPNAPPPFPPSGPAFPGGTVLSPPFLPPPFFDSGPAFPGSTLGPPGSLDSVIILNFPEIFAEFRTKRFYILWRGSRDGFSGSDFHDRCDGHANTLTVILDTKGNIFGGFTPVQWQSEVVKRDPSSFREDASLTSFLFTLTNPKNVPPRRFPLNDKKHEEAKRRLPDSKLPQETMLSVGECGPYFGSDIQVSWKVGRRDFVTATHLGNDYTNDTKIDPGKFFTGSPKFQVKEIEVFEIID